MDERIGFGLYQPCGNSGSVERMFGLRCCGVGSGLGPQYGRVGWCYVCVRCESGFFVGLGVGSWPSNRATEGSNPKGTRLYFVILLKNVEKTFD